MPIGLLDLSIVTARLIREIKAEFLASRLWIEGGRPGVPATRLIPTVTGLAPDAVRDKDGCQLSVYLFHVAPEPYNRNTYLRDGSRARTVPQLPLALQLHYLVTAYSQESYEEEQQAMSVALKWFHEHPTFTATVPLDGRAESFTMSMAAESVDETGRLWQAINAPMRLSAVYRVSVVFLEPVARTVEPLPVETVKLHVEPLANLPPTPARAAFAGGEITVTGTDFVANEIEVRFLGETLRFVSTAAALTAGTCLFVSDTTLRLIPDPLPAAGHYPVWISRKGRAVAEAWVDVP